MMQLDKLQNLLKRGAVSSSFFLIQKLHQKPYIFTTTKLLDAFSINSLRQSNKVKCTEGKSQNSSILKNAGGLYADDGMNLIDISGTPSCSRLGVTDDYNATTDAGPLARFF